VVPAADVMVVVVVGERDDLYIFFVNGSGKKHPHPHPQYGVAYDTWVKKKKIMISHVIAS
jgi:hypothetical protein